MCRGGHSCNVMMCGGDRCTHTQWYAPLLDAVERTALEAATPDLAATIPRLGCFSASGDECLVRNLVDDLSNGVHNM